MCTQSFHPECLQLTEADLDTILKQPHFICSECSENEQVQSEHHDLCVGACSYCIPYLVSITLNKTPLKTLFVFSQRKRSCFCWNPLSMLTKTIQDRLNYVRKRWALFRLFFQEYDRLPNTGHLIKICRIWPVCVTSNEHDVLLLIACSVIWMHKANSYRKMKPDHKTKLVIQF